MIKDQNKLPLILYCLSIFAALIVLTDFILAGKVIIDEVIDVKKERQQYYNAARNHHYSYKVTTSKHHFTVSDDFAQLVQDNQKIEYSVSRIFKEVNRYRLVSSENSAIYSLRIISGLIIPLSVIIAIGVAYKYKKKISTIVFVLQILLIVDLIFLIK